jgi:hypothetical protein
MYSVLIIFPQEETKAMSATLRDNEMLCIKENQQMIFRNHQKTIGSDCYRLSIHHTPTGYFCFSLSFIPPLSTGTTKTSKTDSMVVQL